MAQKRASLSPARGGKLNPKSARHDKYTGRIADQSGRLIGNDRKARGAAMGTWQEQAGIVSAYSEKVYAAVATSTITARTLKGARIVNPDRAFYPKEIFANQAEYDASVDSVVARIKSGAVKARTPDE